MSWRIRYSQHESVGEAHGYLADMGGRLKVSALPHKDDCGNPIHVVNKNANGWSQALLVMLSLTDCIPTSLARCSSISFSAAASCAAVSVAATVNPQDPLNASIKRCTFASTRLQRASSKKVCILSRGSERVHT